MCVIPLLSETMCFACTTIEERHVCLRILNGWCFQSLIKSPDRLVFRVVHSYPPFDLLAFSNCVEIVMMACFWLEKLHLSVCCGVMNAVRVTATATRRRVGQTPECIRSTSEEPEQK